MTEKDKHNKSGLLTLAIIWLVGSVGDRIWFALDRSIPAWDQAAHLTAALDFRQALQNPQWFSGEWWTSFWQLSPKFPPLTYILTVPFLNLFGTGLDQSTLVNLVFSAILLVSVYGLGIQLFTPQVGLWAAGLCLLMPNLYGVRLDYLLDYPLTALVTLSFLFLTVWKFNGRNKQEKKQFSFDFLWMAAFGISFGLALMVKQTALFFLLTPLLWVFGESLLKRTWGKLAQLIGGLLLCVAVFGPWYRINWLFILSSGKRATIDSAIREHDPGLNTIDAWTYYWNHLPELVTWHLLLVPIVLLLLYWGKSAFKGRNGKQTQHSVIEAKHSAFKWLAVFWVGAYLISSLNLNKDPRYVAPFLPVLSLFLAYGLTRFRDRTSFYVRWATIGFAALIMFFNVFPVGGSFFSQITHTLSPYGHHYAYLGAEWPHTQVINEIIKTEPYLRSTIGVLPSTGQVNQHNFNYYGALQNFQVYGRQVGTRQKQVAADARSLSWFLTKTGDRGSVPKEAQDAIVQVIEQSGNFQLHKTWDIPDGSILKLYHSRVPPVQVKEGANLVETRFIASNLVEPQSIASGGSVRLNRVVVPEKTPPGVPVPVTYEWSGSWDQLQSGLVLLTWQIDSKNAGENTESTESKDTNNPKSTRWLHDRSIGMGALHPGISNPNATNFTAIEQTAMLPGADVATGTYTLKATYLNRKTGETYPISVPPVVLKIDPAFPPTPAPELDLVTQLRSLAARLPEGRKGLEPVFDEVGRINQYDPVQDYLVQAQQSLEYRLKLEPQNLNWAYNLALAKVLQKEVSGAIAALERVTQLDSQNPYAYAYLAFVHLYNWNPKAAQNTLKPAFALNPDLLELKALNGIAALMQGNFIQAWHTLQELQIKH